MLPNPNILLFASGALATPMLSDLYPFFQSRAVSCPQVHVFGARETTVPQGFGSSITVVNLILSSNPNSTKEEIIYPATGGNTYSASARAGVQAVTNQVSAFAAQCPDTMIVLVGYSQGAQIMDDAMCGGGDMNAGIANSTAPISKEVASKVKAMIWMGDPRHTPGAPYNVGNATNPGFAPRPSGQICTAFADIIQSYCDEADPFCSKGNDTAVHQGYGKEYGSQALTFVNSKLAKAMINSTTTSGSTSSTPSSTPAAEIKKAAAGRVVGMGNGVVGVVVGVCALIYLGL